jgi:hypothetical protein
MTRIVRWSAIAVIVTALFAALYLVMQQIERQGADDAPGRLASQLSDGSSVDDSATDQVDLASSDAVFYVVYDRSDRPVAGTGRLDGSLATPPAGVLDQARRAGSNHVTWQLGDGRRFATVERRAGDRIVLAGQSLAPTEARIDRIGLLILAAWACVLLVVLGGFLVERFTDGASERARRAAGAGPRGA